MRHYLMTTDEHFAAAVKADEEAVTGEAAQKAAQQVHAENRGGSQPSRAGHQKTPVVLGLAMSCDTTQLLQVAEEGFEPPTRGL
jgi:hypothetical protein